MTEVERQALGVTLAGKNQYRVLASVMQNFQHAQEATTTAINSSGSAMHENEAYMESLEARTNLLKAQFQELSNNVIKKDLVGAFLDLGQSLLSFANTGLGQVITKMVMLGGLFGAGSALLKASGIIKGITGSFKALLGVIKGIEGAKLTSALPMGIGLGVAGIVGVVEGVKALSNVLDPLKQLQKGLQDIQKEQEAITSNQKIIDLANRYQELRDKVNLDAKEESELKNIRSELATATNGLVNENNDFNTSLDNTVGVIKKINEQELLKHYNNVLSELNDTSDEYAKTLNKVNDQKQLLNSLEQAFPLANMYANEENAVKNLNSALEQGQKLTHANNTESVDYTRALEDLRIKTIALTGSYFEAGTEVSILINALNNVDKDNIGQGLSDSVKAIRGQIIKATDDLNPLIQNTEEYEDAVADLLRYSESLESEGEQPVISYAEAVKLLGGNYSLLNSALQRYDEAHKETIKDSEGSRAVLSKEAETLATQLEKVKPLKDAMDALGGAYKDLSDKGNLTTKSIEALQTNFGDVENLDNYIDRLIKAKDDSDEFTNILVELGNAKLATSDSSEILANTDKVLIDVIMQEAGVVGGTEQAFLNLRASMILANEAGLDFSQQKEELYSLAMAAGVARSQMDAVSGQGYDWEEAEALGMGVNDYMLYRLKQTIQNAAQYRIIGFLQKGSGDGDGDKDKNYTSTTKIDKTTNDVVKAYENLVDLRKSEYELMEKQESSAESLVEKIQEIQSALYSEVNELTTILNNAEALGLTNEEINSIQININKLNAEWYDWQDKINDLLKDNTNALEKASEILNVELNQEKEAIEALQSRMIDYYDNQIKAIDNKIAALQKSNDELNKQIELEEKLDAIARAKQQQQLVYTNGGWQYITDADKVSAASADLETFLRQQKLNEQIDKLNQEKSALENFKNSWQNITKDYDRITQDWLIQQKLGFNTALDDWEKFVSSARKYANEYTNLLSRITAFNSSTSNNVQYDRNVDYAAKILESNSLAEAQAWGVFREAKIRGENVEPDRPTSVVIDEWSKAHGYANGTLNAVGGLSLVGEHGAELRVLNNGDGILPNYLTRNLMQWGQIAPTQLGSLQGSNLNVTIQTLSLPNVADGQGFVNYVKHNMFGQVLSFVH